MRVATDALEGHERRHTLLPRNAARRCSKVFCEDEEETKKISYRRDMSSPLEVTVLLTFLQYPCYVSD